MQPQRKTSSPDVMESCLEQRSRGVNKTLQRVRGEHQRRSTFRQPRSRRQRRAEVHQPIVVHRDLDRAAYDRGHVVDNASNHP